MRLFGLGLTSILVFLSFGKSAFADSFTFNNGAYISSKRFYVSPDTKEDKPIRILRRGDEIRVIDAKNNLTYVLNLASKEQEQLVNPKLLDLMRRSPGTRIIGNLIDKITISDIQELPGNVLSVNFNLYLKTSSVFGGLSAKVQIGAQSKSVTCKIEKTENSGPPTFQYSEQNYDGTCLTQEVGTQAGVLELNTGLPHDINNAVGLASDLLIKLMSPTFSHRHELFERR